jgi:hypothetical protein
LIGDVGLLFHDFSFPVGGAHDPVVGERGRRDAEREACRHGKEIHGGSFGAYALWPSKREGAGSVPADRLSMVCAEGSPILLVVRCAAAERTIEISVLLVLNGALLGA